MSFEEQIMSKDKYPSFFLHQIKAINCVFYPSNIFHNMCGFQNWGMLYTYCMVPRETVSFVFLRVLMFSETKMGNMDLRENKTN